MNLCMGACKQQRQDGNDNMVGIFMVKPSHKHCPTTLTVIEHQATLIETQTPPLLFLL